LQPPVDGVLCLAGDEIDELLRGGKRTGQVETSKKVAGQEPDQREVEQQGKREARVGRVAANAVGNGGD
jgi:hypothetical protein